MFFSLQSLVYIGRILSLVFNLFKKLRLLGRNQNFISFKPNMNLVDLGYILTIY